MRAAFRQGALKPQKNSEVNASPSDCHKAWQGTIDLNLSRVSYQAFLVGCLDVLIGLRKKNAIWHWSELICKWLTGLQLTGSQLTGSQLTSTELHINNLHISRLEIVKLERPLNYDPVTFCQVKILVSWQTDRQTDSSAYEPTKHRCAKKKWPVDLIRCHWIYVRWGLQQTHSGLMVRDPLVRSQVD